MATLWDTLFEASPAGGDSAMYGDDAIRGVKTSVRERLVKEHYHDLAEAGLQPRQGLHRAGSAVAFYQADAPTQRNGTNLSAADAGLLWFDTDTKRILAWDGTAWGDIEERVVSVSDANLAVKTGWYAVETPFLNVPEARLYMLAVMERGGIVRQTLYDSTVNSTYERIYVSSAWSDWEKNYRAADLPVDILKGITGLSETLTFVPVYTHTATPYVSIRGHLYSPSSKFYFFYESILAYKTAPYLTTTMVSTNEEEDPWFPGYESFMSVILRLNAGKVEVRSPMSARYTKHQYVITPYA